MPVWISFTECHISRYSIFYSKSTRNICIRKPDYKNDQTAMHINRHVSKDHDCVKQRSTLTICTRQDATVFHYLSWTHSTIKTVSCLNKQTSCLLSGEDSRLSRQGLALTETDSPPRCAGAKTKHWRPL